MFPFSPTANGLNCAVRNFKNFGDSLLLLAFAPQFPDCHNLTVAKLGHPVRFSFLQASLSLRIPYILYLLTRKKVLRIAAWRIITTVENACTFRNGLAYEQFQSGSMSKPGFIVNADATVSVHFAAIPKPAFVRSSFCNLYPKSFFKWKAFFSPKYFCHSSVLLNWSSFRFAKAFSRSRLHVSMMPTYEKESQ